ncbi:unnamed protein product, partial [Bubo scandiacus]
TMKVVIQPPCSKPSPQPGVVPEPYSCIQVAGSHEQGPAERRMCLYHLGLPGLELEPSVASNLQTAR